MNNLENQFGVQIQPNLQIKEMKIEIDKEWFTVEKCIANPHKLYIFGDNLMRIGRGGQAQIRDCFNSTGLATKCAPTMNDNAFFRENTQEEEDYFKNVISKDVFKIKQRFFAQQVSFDTIVFPADGLGTGLSKLPEKAPGLYNFLKEILYNEFGVKTNQFNGKLSYPKATPVPYEYNKVEN